MQAWPSTIAQPILLRTQLGLMRAVNDPFVVDLSLLFPKPIGLSAKEDCTPELWGLAGVDSRYPFVFIVDGIRKFATLSNMQGKNLQRA